MCWDSGMGNDMEKDREEKKTIAKVTVVLIDKGQKKKWREKML